MEQFIYLVGANGHHFGVGFAVVPARLPEVSREEVEEAVGLLALYRAYQSLELHGCPETRGALQPETDLQVGLAVEVCSLDVANGLGLTAETRCIGINIDDDCP